MTNYLKFLLFYTILDLRIAESKMTDKTVRILNNLKNLSGCATLDESLNKLAKQSLTNLNYEKYVLERYTVS